MDFEVVIVGSDINAYYMARCCHEAYEKKVYMIGKEPMRFTSLSKIIQFSSEPNLWDSKVFCNILETFAKKFNNKKLLLIGTNDTYIRLMVENQTFLKQYYVFHAISKNLLNSFLKKDEFYVTYANESFALPETFIYSCKEKNEITKEFSYPMILKPGDGVEYHKHEFEGMAKVFKIHSKEERDQVIKKIEASGYTGNLILQEFIPGDDSMLFDSIFYVDRNHQVKLISFGQIGLQEHTQTGVGNCTVLVQGYSEYGENEEMLMALKEFMERINYVGFAEFDMKYDIRDNTFKVLEINPRQARSSYFLTACGHNLVKLLVEDLIEHKQLPYVRLKEEMVLTFVPKTVIKKYIENDTLKKKVLSLIKQKKYVDPLNYKKDNLLKRKLYLLLRKINYIKKYKHNNW